MKYYSQSNIKRIEKIIPHKPPLVKEVSTNFQLNSFRKKNSGFTLLEVMIVVVIMGVMAAIATPNFFSLLDTIRVGGAAKNLASEMMLAKFRAISENHKYIVTFDVTGNSFSIYSDSDNDYDTIGLESNEIVKTVNIVADYPNVVYGYVTGTKGTSGNVITESVTFTSNPKRVVFKPDGTANIPGSIYLILSKDLAASKSGRMRAVTVIQTGRIKFWRYKGAPSSKPWE